MSNTASTPPLDFTRLLRAAEGLTQWRPLVLGFSTLVIAGLVGMAGAHLAGPGGGTGGAVLSLLLALVALVLAAAGFSGAGVMLMDRAKGIAPRSMIDALVFGLMCLPKFIGFGIVLALVFVALALVAALVYLVCKIPGIGPVLLFAVHPVLVLVAGLVFTVVMWVACPLFAPAVWDGRSFKESLSVVFAVARARLLHVVVMLLALYVLASLIVGLIVGAIFPGYLFMTGLAASVVSPQIGNGGLASIFGMFSGADSGYLYAGLMATALLVGAAMALMLQVFIMGVNLVYLAATEGLDISGSQAQIERHMEQAKRKAREAQERARAAADRARSAPQPAMAVAATAVPQAATPVAMPPPASFACPACGATANSDDLFCGGCGHKLK